jgi:hypothetical protein
MLGPVFTDGMLVANLMCWLDGSAPESPDTLDLATANVRAPTVCYQLEDPRIISSLPVTKRAKSSNPENFGNFFYYGSP